MNILLVDDDEAASFYNEIILKRANNTFNIITQKNGEEAIGYLQIHNNEIDLILLDINMPIMNGHEFLENYSSFKYHVQVVMLSTSILKEDKDRAIEYEFVKGFINKPLSYDLLKKYAVLV